jgi:hypothetical protein
MMTSVLVAPAKIAQSPRSMADCHIYVTRLRLFPDSNFFCLRFAETARAVSSAWCFDACRPFNSTDGWRQLRGNDESARQEIDAEGQLRRMLLPLQPSLCARSR